MTRLISKELPNWLQPGRDVSHASPGYFRSIRYHFQIWVATPDWLTDEQRSQVRAIYKEKKRRRNNGEKVHVDHIVPLCSDLVCGLHVPWNMQIISEVENMAKSNTWWPDCPHDNHELFDKTPEPYQLRFSL